MFYIYIHIYKEKEREREYLIEPRNYLLNFQQTDHQDNFDYYKKLLK